MDFSSFHNDRPCKACTSTEEMMRIGKAMVEKRKQQREHADGAKATADAESSTKNGAAVEGAPDEGDEAVGVARRRRSDCPVDKDELGRSTWNLLHTMSVYYPEAPDREARATMAETLNCVAKTYPCAPCAEDFRQDLVENPPQLGSRSEFARWMCEMHNRVNDKIGKDRFDCGRVMERWYDGWKDGSCDYK